MTTLGSTGAALADWWAKLPILSDLGMPPPNDPALTVVIATLVAGFGLAGFTNGWVERRTSKSGLFAILVGVFLFVWVWQNQTEFGLSLIPESFIELLARMIR